MATALEVIGSLTAAGAEAYAAFLAVRDEESSESANVIMCGNTAWQYAGSGQWDVVEVIKLTNIAE